MDAVNPIDQLNTLRRIQQALDANRNDIGALLELAVLQEKDELRRKVLAKVLTLDPVNKQAREMLLDLDRAQMNAEYSPMAPIVPTAERSATAPTVSRDDPLERSLVSRYSIIHQIVAYGIAAYALTFMVGAFESLGTLVVSSVLFLIASTPLWFTSAVVRVDRSGISLSRLFGVYRREMAWNEIASLKAGPMGVGMRLRTAEGWSMAVSSQMSQYPVIVEVLRTVRPDLFILPDNSAASGSKTFQKRFFGKYWLLCLSIATSFVFLVSIPTIIPAIILGIVLYFMWNAALYGVHTVHLEGNRLSTRSFRRQQELTAQQIKDIRMVTRYSRQGVATRLIQVELLGGTHFALTGFPEGNEIMYGFLKRWWSSYQNV